MFDWQTRPDRHGRSGGASNGPERGAHDATGQRRWHLRQGMTPPPPLLLANALGGPMLTLVLLIDEATKEKTSGQFVLHEDGSKVPW